MAVFNGWPDLSQLDLQPTAETLHIWSQVVGKIRLSRTPWTNHSWHVPLYVSANGLTTGLIPAGPRAFEIEFDLIGDALIIRDTDGLQKQLALTRQSVATFYANTIQALKDLGIDVHIDPMPCELPEAVTMSCGHMKQGRHAHSGMLLCRRTAFSRFSARVLWVNAVQSICSGAVSILRLHAFRAARRRPTPVECRMCRAL
jgi:hypothetical protein